MKLEELKYTEQWATLEGWNPGRNDIACYSRLDSNGFFLAEADGEPAGCAFVLNFSDTFSSVGALIVKPEYRGGKVGLALIRRGIEHVGARTAYFDSVENKVRSYMLLGGKPLYSILRCEMAAVSVPPVENLVDLTSYPFEKLMEYDRAFFPADRAKLMAPWIDQKPDGAALGIWRGGQLAGYGVIRKAHTGYRIEPLYAETPELGETLLLALTSRVERGAPVYLNLPETNAAAMAWMKKYGMKTQIKLVRMYRGTKLESCDISKIYSVLG
ncbi:MAG: GNAT family N-acetyltransferase [Elusimicrobiaceae bacterium]